MWSEDLLGSAAVADAGDHGRVVLLVGKDHAARKERGERRERCFVGDEGGREQKRHLLAVEIGKFAFEFDVVVGRAGDVARAARAGADEVDRLVHRGEHLGVLAHAQIIVGAPNGYLLCGVAFDDFSFGERASAALHIGENPITALTLHGVEGFGEHLLVIHQSISAPIARRSLFWFFYVPGATKGPVPFRRAEDENLVRSEDGSGPAQRRDLAVQRPRPTSRCEARSSIAALRYRSSNLIGGGDLADAVLLVNVAPELDDAVLGRPGADVDEQQLNGLFQAERPAAGPASLICATRLGIPALLVGEQPGRQVLDIVDADAARAFRAEVAAEDAIRRGVVHVDGVGAVEIDLEEARAGSPCPASGCTCRCRASPSPS